MAPVPTVVVKKGALANQATLQQEITATLAPGFHLNSATPHENFLIPLRLKWEPGTLVADTVEYPKPHDQKYSFSDQPISVLEGEFKITTKFKVADAATPGTTMLTGKLRYQACNNQACFPPKTVEVKLPVQIQ